MNAAWLVAAIGFGAAIFMIGFLIALLRESAPSVCYWVGMSGWESHQEKEDDFEAVNSTDDGQNCHSPMVNVGECCWQLAENENHEKRKCSSGLIAFDVHIISDELGWRANQPGRNRGFRERHRFE
jgi:hypothetical protein